MGDYAGSFASRNAEDLLEEWQIILDSARNNLVKANELATRMESACKSSNDDDDFLEMIESMQRHEADSDYEICKPTVLSEDSLNQISNHAESSKLTAEILRDQSTTKPLSTMMLMTTSADLSQETHCHDTSLDLFKRRKTIHEISQLIVQTPEAVDKFKRRRSTGEVPRTPRMQLSCVNSPGTPSANVSRTPIPLAKSDLHTPDTHFHPPLHGKNNSCRKRDLFTSDNVTCPDTPPLEGKALTAFSAEDITSVFSKLQLEAPSRLTPANDSRSWESDMNAAYFSAFKLISTGMDRVKKGTQTTISPKVCSSSSEKSESIVSAVDDVMKPLSSLMNQEIVDEEAASKMLDSIEDSLLRISKKVPLEQTSDGCADAPNFFHRRVVQRIETMTNFMRKANNKITDEMREVHFLGTDNDFGGTAAHVTQLLESYKEAICQLDDLTLTSSEMKFLQET